MKVAVTTASGNLGTAIVKEAVSQLGKENVVGIARTPEKAKHLGIEIRKGDYNSKEDFDIVLQGMEVVLLVSGMDAPDKRLTQHLNVIRAAKEAGVRKIVYTSIIGPADISRFSPIVSSNRQTEEHIKNNGMEWIIGRNGLYLEPDLEYLDHYTKTGKISNSAGDGKCAYTTRDDLAKAYVEMIRDDRHNGQTYNLVGESISQSQLVNCINEVFGTSLIYEALSTEEYLKDRQAAHGEFLGTIIAGIYEGIKLGYFDIASDFYKILGRKHTPILEIMKTYKKQSQIEQPK